MQLLTPEIEARFKEVGQQQEVDDPIVIAKFFNASGTGTWYATEYDPVNYLFFGYVSLFGDENDEWGSFGLAELQDVRGRFGLGIERDIHCGEKPISEFKIPSLVLT